MTVVVRRRKPATQALTEFEAWECVQQRAAGWSIAALAAVHGISRRTVWRYLERVYRCRHCAEEFRTVAALWDHMWLSDEEAV